MKSTIWIMEKRDSLNRNRVDRSYLWEGDSKEVDVKVGIIERIDSYIEKVIDKDTITLGEYILRVVKENIERDVYECVRLN